MKPRAEQLRFRSTKTGNHIIDAYLEAAEYGDRTLADLLADIFNADGEIRPDIYHFRVNPTTRFMQVRIGDWATPEAGWVNVDNGQLFRERGAYTDGVTYYQTDFVTYLGGRYMNLVATVATTPDPDPTKWVLVSTVLTASDILARLITVDGAGSGLDADFLDGQSSAFYQNASNLNAGTLPGARFTDASHGIRTGGTLHAEATALANGFMTSAQFTKLANIEPLADVTDVTNVVQSLYDLNVDVPIDTTMMFGQDRRFEWSTIKTTLKTFFDDIYFKASSILTDAQHGSRGGGGLHAGATTASAGFMSTAQVTKLNGIETAADVTDLTNVRSSLNGSAEANPVDATMMYAADRKFSWLNLKAVLRAAFDPVYVLGSGNADVASTPGSIAQRDASGDINARLFRSEYDATNATIGLIVTQVDTVSNNYMRPSTPAQVAAALAPVMSGDMPGRAYPRRVGGVDLNFNWSGQSGQPTYLWGSNDGTNLYVWNPANFNVNSVGGWTQATINNQIETRGRDWGEWAVANLTMSTIAAQGAGAVGTYGFFQCNATGSVGSNRAGTSLNWARANGGGGGNPSGSWRAMGDYNSNTEEGRTTLFLRYA